jgi:thiamine pyrophosphate-dependent acetolactate synthase large subunit-like protein
MHASMAIYNAYCDRVPIYLILGNTGDATKRRPGADWDHSVLDPAAMVREYIKWDDLPASLPHFAESAVRAYKIAMTPPMMPVVLIADSELQENPVPEGVAIRTVRLSSTSPPQGDSGTVGEAARLLAGAQHPVIIADRVARTAAGMKSLIELAELLQAPVIDQAGRMNFPSRHPLNRSAARRNVLGSADVVIGLELTDFWGTIHSFRDQLHRSSDLNLQSGAKLISISAGDLYTKSNYQDIQRYTPVDVSIGADAEVTLPSLTEEIRRQLTPDRKRMFAERGAKVAEGNRRDLEQARLEATYAWDASPISMARLCAELWAQIKNEDWSLVSFVGPVGGFPIGGWPLRLWSFDKYHQFIGGSGASGIGYNAPASVGAALANKKYGRLSINIQTDGDLMYAPGVLWTAAHHRIPLLTIMHNNRAYHSEVIHVQRMCNQHNRGIENAGIGTTLVDPNIDFAKLAQGMGMHAEGPISDPRELGAAIRRGIATVKSGEPALIDVVTQPR